jgi:hypothetical protein
MNHPVAAPLEAPVDTPVGGPVASRPAAKLPLVIAWLGRIATTTDRSAPVKSVPRLNKPVIRVRQHHVEWVDDRLWARDREIIATVRRVRLASGYQLERLHFAGLSDASRARIRRRVLARLSSDEWRVLATLQRRIGGARRGSKGLVFALDTTGQWLAPPVKNPHGETRPIRRPHTPRVVWLNHALAVSEFYVELVEASRTCGFELLNFATEWDCWLSDGDGSWLGPDAYFRIATAAYGDAWYLEQDMDRPDRHSEALPVIKDMLLRYLKFAQRGLLGPPGVGARVLIRVTNARRQAAILQLVAELPAPADRLFHVTTADQAASYLLRILRS